MSSLVSLPNYLFLLATTFPDIFFLKCMSENYDLINHGFFFGFSCPLGNDSSAYFSMTSQGPQGAFNIPAVCGVQFHSDHIQRVPGRDGQSVIQTQHAYHHGLTAAQPEEETTDPRKYHGATCQRWRQKGAMFPAILERIILGSLSSLSKPESHGEAVVWTPTAQVQVGSPV